MNSQIVYGVQSHGKYLNNRCYWVDKNETYGGVLLNDLYTTEEAALKAASYNTDNAKIVKFKLEEINEEDKMTVKYEKDTISPKYKIGQKVWRVGIDEIIGCKIIKIEIRINKTEHKIIYWNDDDNGITEDNLYSSAIEAAQAMDREEGK